MSTISDLRVLIGDIAKFDRQTATGDGATRQFVVTALPIITGSQVVLVAGVEKASGTDYTLNADLGLITFAAAPTDGQAIVVTFQYAEISDESLAAILVLEPDVYAAAALAARSISGRYTSLVDKQVGDLRISYSQRAKAWMDLAKKLESGPRPIAAGSGVWLGGKDVADKQSNEADATLTKPYFRRDMHINTPPDDQIAEVV